MCDNHRFCLKIILEVVAGRASPRHHPAPGLHRWRAAGETAVDEKISHQLASNCAVHLCSEFEAARLRVRRSALEAENEGLRAELLSRGSPSQPRGQQLPGPVPERRARSTSGSVGTRASSKQTERTALLEAGGYELLERLSSAAEAMANDNSYLSRELAAATENAEAAQATVGALQERLSSLEELCIAQARSQAAQKGPPAVAWEAMERELAAPAALAAMRRSRPPATFPAPTLVEAVAAGLPLLGLEADPRPLDAARLARRCAQLQRELERRAREVDELRAAQRQQAELAASERASAQSLAGRQQTALLGALRRLQWLAARQEELETRCAQKERYAAGLENRLLEMHRRRLNLRHLSADTASTSTPAAPQNLNLPAVATAARGMLTLSSFTSESLDKSRFDTPLGDVVGRSDGSGWESDESALRAGGAPQLAFTPGGEKDITDIREFIRYLRRLHTSSEVALSEDSLPSEPKQHDGEGAGVRA